MKRVFPTLLTFILSGLLASHTHAVAPTINSTGPTSTQVNQSYSYPVQATDPEGGSLSYAFGFHPPGMTIDANGTVSWTPTVADAGKHVYKIVVEDEEFLEAVEYVEIDVIDPNNNAPVFAGTPITETFTNTLYQLDVQATDPDGDALVYTIASWPEATGLSIDANGIVNWTPALNQIGEYWVWVTADDQKFGETQLSFELRVLDPANNPPVIGNKRGDAIVNIGHTFTYDLQAADADGDPLNHDLQIWPQVNDATISAAGVVTWTPGTENQTEHFLIVNVDDGKLGEDTHSFKLTVVNTGNTPPTITTSPVTSVEINTAYQYDVDATDPESDPLSYSLVASPSGMTIDATTGVINWSPDTTGDYSIEIAVNDGINPSVTQTYTLTVTPPSNTAPTANDQSITTTEDTAASIILSASDNEGDALTFNLLTSPAQGTLTGTAPNLSYTPNANATGADTFTFQVNDGVFDSNIATVSLDITAINDAPTASPITASTNEDTAVAITLSGSDIENSPLSFILDTQPANGILSGTAANLSYTPNANFAGVDTFTYHVNDGELDSAIATVSITVAAHNDAPVADGQALSTDEDQPIHITLTGSDIEGDALTFVIDAQPTNGTLSGTAPNLIYTPNANFHGSDAFTFHVNDGALDSAVATVLMSVNSVNDAPTADAQSLSTNEDEALNVTLIGADIDGDALTFVIDAQPANGTLSGTAPNLTYTPNANYSGADTFTYHVNDGELDSNVATVSISVASVNDAPVADAQVLSTNEEQALSMTLTGNDVDGDALTFVLDTTTANGLLTGTAPNLVYTPQANFFGTDTLSFHVNDGTVDSAVMTVTINVADVNDGPSATPLTLSTAEDTPLAMTLAGSDPENNPLTFAIDTPPTNGTLSGTAPNVTYTPNADYNGSDEFTYHVNDGTVDSTVVAVVMSISPVNDAPTITSTAVTTANEGEAYLYQVTASDIDGDSLQYQLTSAPAGMAIDAASGALTWDIDYYRAGSYPVTLSVTDGEFSQTQSYTLTVTNVDINLTITSTPETETEQAGLYTYDVEVAYDGPGTPVYQSNGHYQPVIDSATGEFTWVVPARAGNRSYAQNPDCSLPLENDDNPYFNLAEWDEVRGLDSNGDDLGQTVEVIESGLAAYFEGNGPPLYLLSDFDVTDAVIQFDVRVDGPADDDWVGFVWGASDPEHSYKMLWGVTGAPGVSIWRFNSSEPLRDFEPPIDGERFIFPGGDSTLLWQTDVNYRVFLDIRPGKTGIYIKNADTDTFIYSSQILDDTHIGGKIGMFVFSQDNAYFRARFVDRQAAPDLMIANMEYVDVDAQTDQIVATVTNRGAASSVATQASLRFHELDANGAVLDWQSSVAQAVPALAPGESHTMTWTYTPLDPRFTLVAGFVDEDAADPNLVSLNVVECNEINNRHGLPLMSVRAEDQLGEFDEQRFSVYAQNVSEAPTISSTAPAYAVVGESYEYPVIAMDPDTGDHLTSEVVQGPAGSSFFLGTSNFVWVPQAADLGSVIDTTLRFTDLEGLYAEETFTITVHQKPEFTSTPVYVARAGQLYTYDVDAIDHDGDALTYSLTESPAGMSIDAISGVISWTPATAGTFEMITVEVSDGRGGMAEQRYPLAVLNPGETNAAPSLAGNVPPANALQRVEYITTFTAADSDGNAPRFSLLDGPRGMVIGETNGVLRWTPPFTEVLSHPVTVQVHDQRGGFDTFSYTITIPTPSNTPPSISSTPGQTAEVDQAYTYQVNATDPDGDDLYYRVVVAPWGLSIDQTGFITWTPSANQTGTRRVTVWVVDTEGNYVEQDYTIAIRGNEAPVISSTPPTATMVGDSYQYSVIASDADGDNLSYSLSTAPAGMSIDSAGLVTWAPATGQEGDNDVTVSVSDGRVSTTQSYTIVAAEQVFPPLTIDASVSNSSFDLGGSTVVSVTTQNGLAGLTVSATLDGANLPLDAFGQATVTPTTAGLHTLVATADDGRGAVTDTITFRATDPADTTAPSVTLHSPATDTTLTTAADVIVTVEDDNLESYQVLYKRESEANWNVLATGSAEVTNAAVAVFDTSLLLNGIYQIAIEATDVNGQTAIDNASVMVDGDLKVGNFSFTVRDLTIPLAGIPIEVNRTYDSRRRQEALDFGYGWSVDYQNVLLEESRTPGTGWIVNGYPTNLPGVINHCVETIGTLTVSVTLPNGDVERFEAGASPHCLLNTPEFDVNMVFTAVGDTQSTLVANGLASGRVQGDILAPAGESVPVNPDAYTLTTRAGYIYHLNQDFGVERVEDPNGHTLTYSDSGIVHSSGKAVTFERDTDGQITAVIAPDGERLTYTRDTNGDLTSVVDRDTAQTQYTYNSNHGLVDIIDPLNRRITRNIYDANGRLVGQEDADGNVKTFTHDINARTSLVTDLDGRSMLFNYDDRGNVTEEIKLITDGSYAGDIVTTYTYDANDNQETKTIGASTWTTIHSATNDVEESRNPEGESVYYRNYNPRGQEGEIEDERGHIYTMTYDAVGNLVSVASPEITDPDTGDVHNPVAGNVINAQGLVQSTTDLRGMTTTYTYYPQGHANEYQKATESNAVSGTTSYTYDANNNVASETRERSVNGSLVQETTTYTYDARDRVIRTTHHDGTYTQTDYDLAGNTERERDRFGNWTDYDYDLYGRLIETEYADGTTETRTYTAEGLLDTVTDRMGRVTRNVYDDAGRLAEIHNDADGTYTETQYNDNGWVIAETDALRNLTEYEYDLAGRRTAVVRHINGTTQRHTFTYYPNGELQSETDALNHTTTYVLNELDQRIEVIYDNGTSMQERFDFMGTRIRGIDQENRITYYNHDDLGRLSRVYQPTTAMDGGSAGNAGAVTMYTYDQVGNKLTQTDAEGRTTTWTYDLFGRVLTRQLPAGMTESFVYTDGEGCLPTDGLACATAPSPRTTVRTDFNGDTTTMAYDLMGRLIATQYSKDGNSEVYTYYANDQVHTVTDQHGTTTYTYDVRDRLETETKPDGTVMTYSYDDNGNRTSVSVTRSGTITSATSYTYDALNRLENVTDASGTTTYAYDAVGNLDTVTYPNGVQTDYDYNTINQLTDVYTRDPLNVVISHFNYTLTPTGRREVITELDGRTTTYTYDELYRLETESIVDAANGDYSATYEYDLVGNREYETVDGVQTAYTYDFNDRLVQTGGTTYTYDDNGNTLTETLDGNTKTYTWDGKNKLTTLDDGTTTTTFTYNYRGIRTSKTANAVTTSFIVDENTDYAQVLEEVESGSATVTYSYGHDLLNQERAGTYSYYHYDGLGSTRALSDDIGSITDSYNYEAFGDVLNQTGSTENNYLFTGEQFDQSLNQYYLRARYYDQGIGRFTQMDTYPGRIGEPATLHKYLYTHADPVNGIDPTGLYNLAEVNQSTNIVGQQATARITTFSGSLAPANGATYAAAGALTNREIGLLVLSGLGAAGAKLFDMLSSREDDESEDSLVPYYRAVETGEMVDILDCQCFRFLDSGWGIEPTAIKRFWLEQPSAVTFGYQFILGNFAGADDNSFFVVTARVSEVFDEFVTGLPGGANPGDSFIGAGRAVPLNLLPAFNAEIKRHGNIQMLGEYQ